MLRASLRASPLLLAASVRVARAFSPFAGAGAKPLPIVPMSGPRARRGMAASRRCVHAGGPRADRPRTRRRDADGSLTRRPRRIDAGRPRGARHPRRRPSTECRRDAPPPNTYAAPAASPRRASAEYVRGARGVAATDTTASSRAGFPLNAVGVADVLKAPKWPADWPYAPRDFTRGDESPDPRFYDMPRFCFHVDDAAVAALTDFYGTAFREWEKPAILDICASHVSHFPSDVADFAGKRVALGMNEEELQKNGQVDSYVVKDLNEEPILPFEDNSFDIVTNVVSIDYLTQPLAICKEVARVLKPGGQAMFALSNRCFPTKAVDIWLRTNDLEHVFVVGSCFRGAEHRRRVAATPRPC